MTDSIAALPMYDWPETRAETDAEWARLRDAFRRHGVGAPERVVRRNADLPPVSGGVVESTGEAIAPDPATLPQEELDFHTVWLYPGLLFAQTCWGPMELGLSKHVQVIGQPDYSAFEGGQGVFYSSAIIIRRGAEGGVRASVNGKPVIPLDLLRDRRFAYNSTDSMSGILAITRDLEAMGESLAVFSELIESGGHRNSVVAVAKGRADVAAIDCRSWALAQRFEPAAREVAVVGWTARRKGLPYITARSTPAQTVEAMRLALAELGLLAPAPAANADQSASRRSSSG